MDISTDKLSIKNLLFTKTLPNYVIPTPTNGHKVYACTDCGDKFIFESSYTDHINRKSAKISYVCRNCNQLKIFNNRCNLLFHIRSHAFKTATINVSDLKVEPLPLSFYKLKPTVSIASTSGSKQCPNDETTRKAISSTSTVTCFECKANVTTTGVAYKDRSSHFMQYTKEVYSCPVCLFALPSICALKVHLRLHLKQPPYYCSECGVHLANKNVQYPYNHDCEGFKMMRATARLNCTVSGCCLFHPNDYKEHMKKYHLKKVYKCPFCVVACFNEATMENHLKGHKSECKALIFYQCDVCPRKYVLQNPKLNDHHLKSHISSTVFPCWACGSAFKEVSSLLKHVMKTHNKTNLMEKAVNDILNENTALNIKSKKIYRVVKKCDQCKRSFTYKCKYDEIPVLPSECPYKCNSTLESNVMTEKLQNSLTDHIVCHLCKIKISQDWKEITKHYVEFHKTHKCLEAEILLTRIDISKYMPLKKYGKSKVKRSINKISKKLRHAKINKVTALRVAASKSPTVENGLAEQNETYECSICGDHSTTKSMLEKHIMTSHRDPCMAYQCMECGLSYMVKPTFSKHLLLEHGITDTEEYINSNECYNADALSKGPIAPTVSTSPTKENQCNICLQQFDDAEDLAKHYRVHGMAFLVQNTLNKNSTSK